MTTGESKSPSQHVSRPQIGSMDDKNLFEELERLWEKLEQESEAARAAIIRESEERAKALEAQLTCRGPCPFTEGLSTGNQVPTEIVALIAGNLDKRTLLAFRCTNKKIAGMVNDVFKRSFHSVQYTLPNLKEYFRCRDLSKSPFSSNVKSLKWVEKKRDGFSSMNPNTTQLMESPSCFENLERIILRSDVDTEDMYWHEGRLSFAKHFSQMFACFNLLLSRLKRPLTVVIEICGLVSCEIPWTGTGFAEEVTVINRRQRADIADDFFCLRQPTPFPCFYPTALAYIYAGIVDALFDHSVSALRLHGLEIRITDLQEILSTAPPPEVLEIKNCGLRFDSSVSINFMALKYIGQWLNQKTRHISFLDIEAKLYKGNTWTHLFRPLITSPALESFRFERVENVFFDWDGDGRLDNGERLPSVVQELGVPVTLRKMMECYQHLQSTYENAPKSDDDDFENEE
ncbi:hypothetical protein IWZ01DRAFT_529605 [Phyllosticta capitalensis]